MSQASASHIDSLLDDKKLGYRKPVQLQLRLMGMALRPPTDSGVMSITSTHNMWYMVEEKQLDMFVTEGDHLATWSPREIWLRLNEMNFRQFSEDSRVERKGAEKAKRASEVAEYFSMWSNTVEGGVILFWHCQHW